MFGTIALKYAAGSLSLAEGVSYTIYGDQHELKNKLADIIDPYYLGMIIFGVVSFIFSLGNIENSKYLQIITTILRFLSLFLMMIASIVSMFMYGITPINELEWFNFDYISVLFGNSFLIFMCHHSLSGIIYPIWPQSKVKPMIFYSFLTGGGLLMIEGMLAIFAFGWVKYHPNPDWEFPLEIQ